MSELENELGGSGSSVCRYPRQDLHDDSEEWLVFLKTTDKVALLDTNHDVVFATYVETEEFSDGHTWITNAMDPETGRRVTSYTTDSLAEKRVSEAVQKHRAWLFDLEDTPLEGEIDV